MTTTEQEAEVRRSLALLHAPGDVAEIRALGRETLTGYFNDYATAAPREAIKANGRTGTTGVYTTLNPLQSAVLSRCVNRLTNVKTGGAASDGDVARRRWLLVDLDPVRPAGISSTDSEHNAALDRATTIALALNERGWPMPVLADSGNGAHLLYAVDLPNDANARALVQSVLASMDFEFSDSAVAIDTTVFNAARIVRLYGTTARKGESTADRPHRCSTLLDVPSPVERVLRESLERLAESVPVAQSTLKEPGAVDLARFIERNGIAVRFDAAWNGGRKFILEHCPFDPSHTGSSAALLQLASGAVVFRCLHNGCARRKWQDVRTRFEPVSATQRGDQKERPVFVRASALLNEPGEDIEYVVADLMPLGGTAILAGRPKGGKSTTALNLALCIARGQPFIGRTTRKGPVLYLALEGARGGWKSVIRKIGLTDADDVFFCIDRAPEGPIAWLRDAIRQHAPVLVIIDTMQRLLRVKDGNDYASASNVTDAAIELARSANATLLFVHHSGKTRREDIVDEVMGSTGWAAAVDTVLVMRKTEHCRTIASDQRFGEPMPETVLHMDQATHGVLAMGTKAEADTVNMVGVIVDFVREQPDEAPTEATILEGVTGRKDRKQAALRRAVELGALTRSGTGRKGSPFRYADSASLPPTHASEVANQKADLAGNAHETDDYSASRAAVALSSREGQILDMKPPTETPDSASDVFAYAAERIDAVTESTSERR